MTLRYIVAFPYMWNDQRGKYCSFSQIMSNFRTLSWRVAGVGPLFRDLYWRPLMSKIDSVFM